MARLQIEYFMVKENGMSETGREPTAFAARLDLWKNPNLATQTFCLSARDRHGRARSASSSSTRSLRRSDDEEKWQPLRTSCCLRWCYRTVALHCKMCWLVGVRESHERHHLVPIPELSLHVNRVPNFHVLCIRAKVFVFMCCAIMKFIGGP